ncbi:hypothetical protein [Caballeronia mineralivorans]|uniref:hypothetical protein n=1 Tax=Caballeronia mineralivorans TaxID=2010198 RepID=UPI00069F569A|nr:hypothetical protein [Caballeronia mineralivorans]
MDDLDLIKTIPPEVLKAAYEDTLSPALKETGKFGLDLVKALRLVALPIQYAAALQDRLATHLRKSIERVPEDRRVPPVESLALPIAEQLKYYDDWCATIGKSARVAACGADHTTYLRRGLERHRHNPMSHDTMSKNSMSHDSMGKQNDKMKKHDTTAMAHPASDAKAH